MRYICFKTIVSKVCDTVIDDIEDIQRILDLLREKETTCSLQIKDGPIHGSVRILELDDTRVTWRMIENGSSLKKISDISDITTVTVDSNEAMVTLKPKPSRWSTLDASDN